MSNEIQQVTNPAGPLVVHGEMGPQAPFDLYKAVRRALRGRYLLVSLLAVAGAAAGIYVGQRYPRPSFRSSGLVQIKNTMPPVITETDQNRPMQSYDTFMQSQKLLISSRRVLDMALQDAIWNSRKVRLELPELAVGLRVEAKPRSEYLEISVANPDATVAATAVTSIVNAYTQLYSDQEKQIERQRSGVLEDRRSLLQSRVNDSRTQIQKIAMEFGTDKLDNFFDAAAKDLGTLDAELAEVQRIMATAPGQPGGGEQAPEAATTPEIMSVEQIAMSDPTMRGLLQEQHRLEDRIEELRLRGLGDANPEMKAAQGTLELHKRRVNEYADEYRRFHTAMGPNAGMLAGQSLPMLQAYEANLIKLRKDAAQKMLDVGTKRLELQRLNTEVGGAQAELDQVSRRIEVLRAEGALGGRLILISSGEIPLTPEVDPIKYMLAFAAAGMVALPGMLITLLELLSRRYRYSDEAHPDAMRQIPLLGILPTLKAGAMDGEQMAAVAHCVHQIRVTLSAIAMPEAPPIYVVTSAASNEGKTSLTMALGLSFAASRLRTLVVDCDWMGRGLTRMLHLEDRPGVYEALAPGRLQELAQRLPGGLHALPTGKVSAAAACGMSATALRPLLAEARQHFDIVLIDTGPILGSVEAAVLAQEADGVIFAVARKQQRPLVEQAINRLWALRVKVVGFVFNRAKSSDFQHSSSSRMSSPGSGPKATDGREEQMFAGFGPVVRAVAWGMPEEENAAVAGV